MKLYDTPPAEYAFAYREQPISGNETNGVGVREKIRPRHVFHCMDQGPFPWFGLNLFFAMNATLGIVLEQLKYRWYARRSAGPIAKRKVAVDDPAAMAAQIKTKAIEFGAGVVGVALVTEEAQFEGADVPYKFAVSIGCPMRREEMVHVPHARAGREVIRTYGDVAKVAVRLAEYIRGMGWPAYAAALPSSNDLLQIPLAINAGIGQLGKHGSLISAEYGSNYRLSSVATDLPLAVDGPKDIGVDDLCLNCRRCTIDCPPGAIIDEKQMVRGFEKWYVDFDKCAPYFSLAYGCAICLEVCPWSEPGRGPLLSQKLLAKRQQQNHAAAE